MRRCLDGTLGDSEEVAGFLGEIALVKRLTLCVECIGYPLSSFRNDQLRMKISLHRPFEGGC